MTQRPSQSADPTEPLHEAERGNRRRPGVSDFVRRAIEKTVGESSVIGKDALSHLLQQGDRGRKEVLRIIANEVGEFLRNTDLSDQIVKILTSVEVDLSMNVKF